MNTNQVRCPQSADQTVAKTRALTQSNEQDSLVKVCLERSDFSFVLGKHFDTNRGIHPICTTDSREVRKGQKFGQGPVKNFQGVRAHI